MGHQMYKFWIIGLVLAVLEDHCCSVKIQKITVPSVVVMDHNINLRESSKRPNLSGQEFTLDCEYDIGENEHGLVIKWHLNKELVYQWIPPRAPTALGLFKNRIKENFTFSDDPNKRHRGVAVIKPTLNFSGEYQCLVQTYQSFDKKISRLQIVVPESHFKLTYHTDFDSMVHIKCSAFNVYPEPKLTLNLLNFSNPNLVNSINNVELKSESKTKKDQRDGLYDVKVIAKYPKNSLKSETIINCQLTLPGTNYSKKQETVYYEQDPSLLDSDADDEGDVAMTWESEAVPLAKDQVSSSSKPFTIIFFECYMILFFTIFITMLC